MRIEEHIKVDKEFFIGGLPKRLTYDPALFASFDEFEQLEREYYSFLIKNNLIKTISHKEAMKDIAQRNGLYCRYNDEEER